MRLMLFVAQYERQLRQEFIRQILSRRAPFLASFLKASGGWGQTKQMTLDDLGR